MATDLSTSRPRPSCILGQWALESSENGDSFEVPEFGDKTVTVEGTFDSATVTITGSNDGTNWFTVVDFLGNDCTFTTDGMKTLGNSPRYLRPECGAGSGSAAVNVHLISRGGAK